MALAFRDNAELRRYEAVDDGAVIGLADYRRHGDVLAVVHVEVEPLHMGEGVGTALVAYLLDDLRRRGLSVVPDCPFVHAFIDRHRDAYLALVPPNRREAFGWGDLTA